MRIMPIWQNNLKYTHNGQPNDTLAHHLVRAGAKPVRK